MQFIQLLTRPKDFFASIHEQEPSLKWPFILVTIIGVCSAITRMEGLAVTFYTMGPGLGTFITVFSVIIAIIESYSIWILASVSFYALHRFFEGSGTLNRVVEITGYGMLPFFFISVGESIFNLTYMLRAASISDAQDTVRDQIFGHPLIIISIVIIFWAGRIWTTGFETCCGIDRWKTLITVGIPVLIYILFSNFLIIIWILYYLIPSFLHSG